MKPNLSQKELVKNHLLKFKEITSWEAIREYHITRLSQYILVLRKENYEIESVRESDENNWWVRYILKREPKEEL